MADSGLVLGDLDGELASVAGGAAFADALAGRDPAPRLVYRSARPFEEVRRILKERDLPEPDALLVDGGSEIRLHPSGAPLREWWDRFAGSWDPTRIREALLETSGVALRSEEVQGAYCVRCAVEGDGEQRLSDMVARLASEGVAVRVLAEGNGSHALLPAGAGPGEATRFLAELWGLEVPEPEEVREPAPRPAPLPTPGLAGTAGRLDEAFRQAIEVLRRNVTDRGFTACSMADDRDPRSNYRSVWARDGSMTALWTLGLEDKELTACARRTLETILDAQADEGHLPNYVDVASGEPEFGGIGNIAGIDSAMWVVIAARGYADATGDEPFLRRHAQAFDRTMAWLAAHDSNRCGLLEVPEASDWCDLFPRSYNVLYDEVLWYQANLDHAAITGVLGGDGARSRARAGKVKELLNRLFWPREDHRDEGWMTHAHRQHAIGEGRYLLSHLTPFDYSWRLDVLGNVLAGLTGILDEERGLQVLRYCRQVGVDRPYPVRCLYPAIRPGDPDWREYLTVKLQNLPHQYHNGGVWPFIGGLWVRFALELGEREVAEAALNGLAELCEAGVERPWEFTEWAHGETGMPMGKAYQAWSAASFAAAHLAMQ